VVAPSHFKHQCHNLRETPELQLPREFVKFSCPVTLPISYGPPDLPMPKVKMVVVAVRAQKQSSTKVFVWVKILPPPSHVAACLLSYRPTMETLDSVPETFLPQFRRRRNRTQSTCSNFQTKTRRPRSPLHHHHYVVGCVGGVWVGVVASISETQCHVRGNELY
jgi:hypothetical protein